MFLRRPTTYALEKFRRFEYVPLWYFTDEGRQAADEDEGSNEDLWDVTEISDNCLSLRIASSNPPQLKRVERRTAHLGVIHGCQQPSL